MDVIEYWRQYMRAEGLASRTIEDRMGFINRLQKDTEDILTVSRQGLIFWMSGKPWSNNTRIHNRSTLHTFFTWLQDEGFRPDNPAARLPSGKSTRREPTPFTVQEINQLLDSGVYAKTRAMIALHYYLGLRVSEISRVNGDDINWDRKTITTVGKGNKKRDLPIPTHMWNLCLLMPRSGYWFPNGQTNRLFPKGEGHILGRSVSDTIGDAIRRANLKHRPHDLRAATATQMHKAHVSAFTVQKAMRHSNMQTTTIYLEIDLDQVREGLDALPMVEVPGRAKRTKAVA